MDAKNILTQFDKEEIIAVASELGLTVEPKTQAIEIIKLIREDLAAHGVPDGTELLEDFLYVAGYIDEDGNTLDIEEVVDGVDSSEEVEEVLPDNLPACFTFADIRDPACGICKVYDLCYKKRVENRPHCYGTFAVNDENCQGCIEAGPCGQISISTINVRS